MLSSSATIRYRLACILLALFVCKTGWAQPPVSLHDFAPSITTQVGKNCYAYAAAYVALTTQVGHQTKLPHPDSSRCLSFGFVDGAIQYLQNQSGKKQFERDVANTLYNGNADILGNLDYAFYVLFKYGTCSFKAFPYRTNRDIQGHFKPEMLKWANLQKIGKPIEIYTPDDTYSEAKLNEIKKYLDQGKPIIISIDQPPITNSVWKDIQGFKPDAADRSGNHIVTVIGYDDALKQFEIKNNYALDCTSKYEYKDVFKIIKWAYVYP